MEKENFEMKKKYINNSSEENISKNNKLFFGILGGLLILLIIIGVISFVAIRINTKKVSQDLENGLKKNDYGKWEENLQKISNEIENQDASSEIKERRGKEGDILSDGKLSLILNLVTRKDAIGETKANSGYEFVILYLNIRNQTDKKITFYSSNLILRDLKYTEYSQKNLEKEKIVLIQGVQNIEVGKEIEGNIVFEVKKDSSNLELVYDGEKRLIFEIKQETDKN